MSYDEYLERGDTVKSFADQRESIRQDVPCVFPSHPRFVRTGPRSPGLRRTGSSVRGGDGVGVSYDSGGGGGGDVERRGGGGVGPDGSESISG